MRVHYVLFKTLIHLGPGVIVITISMILVASTSFFTPADPSETISKSDKDPRIGVVLVVIGCLAQGVQYVFEEKVMAVDNAPPLVVIGMEGLWGTVLTMLVVYPLAYLAPGADGGSFENPYDALYMINNNKSLKTLCVLFVFTVTIYNCMAVYVTKYLSAIWHAILDNFRPVTIWSLDLAIFYFIYPNQGFGEEWVPASWLQLCGLLVLFFGTAIYNGSVSTCDPLTAAEDAENVIKTPVAMSSPYISKSPLIHAVQLKDGSANGGYSAISTTNDTSRLFDRQQGGQQQSNYGNGKVSYGTGAVTVAMVSPAKRANEV